MALESAQIRPASSREAGLLILAAIVALAALLVGWIFWQRHHRLNFHVVEPGVLYRSAQPDAATLRGIVNKYHIRTIVNLQLTEINQTDPSAQSEAAFAKDNHIRIVYMPAQGVPTVTEVKEFLALMRDPANRPVLVHCAAGKERTGVMVGVYRMLEQGWSAEQARSEMEACGSSKPVNWDYMVKTAEAIMKAEKSSSPLTAHDR